jgi:collagen type I alpha
MRRVALYGQDAASGTPATGGGLAATGEPGEVGPPGATGTGDTATTGETGTPGDAAMPDPSIRLGAGGLVGGVPTMSGWGVEVGAEGAWVTTVRV